MPNETLDTNAVKQPRQPIVVDAEGIQRFQGNAVVKYIMEHGGFDPYHLAALDFPEADKCQFAQLQGITLTEYQEFFGA